MVYILSFSWALHNVVGESTSGYLSQPEPRWFAGAETSGSAEVSDFRRSCFGCNLRRGTMRRNSIFVRSVLKGEVSHHGSQSSHTEKLYNMDHHRGKSPLVTLLQANYEKDEGKTWENSPETAFFFTGDSYGLWVSVDVSSNQTTDFKWNPNSSWIPILGWWIPRSLQFGWPRWLIRDTLWP